MSGKIEISRELSESEFSAFWEQNKLDLLERKIGRSDCKAIWLEARKVATPVVERQPIGYVHRWELDRISKGQAHWATFWNSNGENNPSRGGDPVALYADQPAPVAVPVEIHQMLIEMRQQFERANFVSLGKLLTACLDKVKELNQ